MFLENCGKFFFSRIHPAFFYCFLIAPFVLTGSYLASINSAQNSLEWEIIQAAKKGKEAAERKNRKERWMRRYGRADPFFLDNSIESLSFANKERCTLRLMLAHPAFPYKKKFQERLDFLEGDLNRLIFREGGIKSSSKVKETVELQRRPIQIDAIDLKKLLAIIEDVPYEEFLPEANRPQLLIRDLRIKKTQTSLGSESFEVEMELLKRQWDN